MCIVSSLQDFVIELLTVAVLARHQDIGLVHFPEQSTVMAVRRVLGF